MLTVKTVLNQVEKHKGFVYGDGRWIKSGDKPEIEVAVYPRKNSTAICSQCARPANAAKFLQHWCRRAMASRIEPMKEMAQSLRSHEELLLNGFKAKKLYSSGVVEGLNNKIKTTTKKSYGFRTYAVLEVQLYHTLGDLPLPEITHKFC